MGESERQRDAVTPRDTGTETVSERAGLAGHHQALVRQGKMRATGSAEMKGCTVLFLNVYNML